MKRSRLERQATLIVRERGLREGGVVPSPDGLHRVVVEGGELARPAVLCVRAGPPPVLAAVASVASEHRAEVLDLPARRLRKDTVWVRLVEYLPTGSLRRRLDEGPLSAGEAATVLIAACDVLRAAHQADLAGVDLRAERIRFRTDGCPVLLGLDDLGALNRERAAVDAAAFLSLAREVTGAIPQGGGAALFARVERAVSSGEGGVQEAVLAEVLPVAVRLPSLGRPGRPSRPSRPGDRVADRPADAEDAVQASQRGPIERAEGIRGDVGWDRWAVILDGDPVGAVRTAAMRIVRGRPKLALVIAVPLAAVIVALAIGPFDAGGAGVSDADVGGGGLGGEVSAAPDPSSSKAGPSTSEPGPEAADTATTMDPARSTCAEDVLDLTGSDRCEGDGAVGVHEEDPAAAALAQLTAGEDGAAYVGATAEVEQRWGDAALIRITPGPESGADSEPGSLLMVRSEAGWRIRAMNS